jgi:hypothetical protein
MEIIVPGGAHRAREGRGTVGPTGRLLQVRKSVGHLPPWRCVSQTRGTFYLCGHCFGTLGDGPATNAAEMWMDGTDRDGAPIVHPVTNLRIVPVDARCEKCGRPAWPAD